jgi:hypothetical protein
MKMARKIAIHRTVPRHDIAKFPYFIGTGNISVASPDSATAKD